MGLASSSDFPFRGYLDFVDNRIDPGTGTIQGRALIDNPDGFLIPGLFARVRLLGSGEYEAVLIHEAAVLTGQDRKFVYVVTDENAAVRRDIVLGREIESLRIVENGLEGGERIVVNGVRKIFFSGAPVNPQSVDMRKWLHPAKLASRDLTAGDVINAIREQDIQVSAGAIGGPPQSDDSAVRYSLSARATTAVGR